MRASKGTGGKDKHQAECTPAFSASSGGVTGNTRQVTVDIHTPPKPPCPELGSGPIPAYGPVHSPPPPSQAAACPDGPNGPETYNHNRPHYITVSRVPIGLTAPADKTRDPESQPRQPIASVSPYFVNTGAQQQPPTIPAVDGLSPVTERATATLAELEYHPGYTRYAYAVDSGTTDAAGRCNVALLFAPVKADLSQTIVSCCSVTAGPPPPAAASILAAALDVEKTWVPGTLSVTPAQSFVVFAPTCIWTTGGTIPAQPQTYETDIAQPDDPATGRHLFYQYLVALTPGPLHIDWGDGFSDDVNPAAAQTGPPRNPPQDCNVQHTYKQVSGEAHGGPTGGLTVRVTQQVTVSATVTSFDGATTVTDPVIPPQQPPALDYTPTPQPTHLVLQIEAVLR